MSSQKDVRNGHSVCHIQTGNEIYKHLDDVDVCLAYSLNYIKKLSLVFCYNF